MVHCCQIHSLNTPQKYTSNAKTRVSAGEVTRQKYLLLTSDIPVTETQTDTEMIDISKNHTETNTEKIFNTDTIYI